MLVTLKEFKAASAAAQPSQTQIIARPASQQMQQQHSEDPKRTLERKQQQLQL